MATGRRTWCVVMVAASLALAGPAVLPGAAAVWCVDGRNAGQADGSAAWPFASIQPENIS